MYKLKAVQKEEGIANLNERKIKEGFIKKPQAANSIAFDDNVAKATFDCEFDFQPKGGNDL